VIFSDLITKINQLFGYTPTQAQLLANPDLLEIAIDAIGVNVSSLSDVATAYNTLMGTSYSGSDLNARPDILRIGLKLLASNAGVADGSITTAKYADGSITTAKLSQPLTLGTPVSPLGVSIVDYAIPTWASIIICSFSGISLSGTQPIGFRLGSGGIPQATAYSANNWAVGNSAASVVSVSTNGFYLLTSAATMLVSGSTIFTAIDKATVSPFHKWAAKGLFNIDGVAFVFGTQGAVNLDGLLNILRVFSGTDTFDGGTLNVGYL
jgi:hypothetical protein